MPSFISISELKNSKKNDAKSNFLLYTLTKNIILASSTLSTLNNRPVNITCSIPYCMSDTPEIAEYYCRIVPFRKDYVCGLTLFPSISDDLGRCDLGNNTKKL